MAELDDYFKSGPLNLGGAYAQRRGVFDGFLGTLDGIASTVGSVGNTVDELAGIRQSWAEGQAAWDDVTLSRQEREQAMFEDRVKVQRGDNVKLYWALAAAGVAVVVVLN